MSHSLIQIRCALMPSKMSPISPRLYYWLTHVSLIGALSILASMLYHAPTASQEQAPATAPTDSPTSDAQSGLNSARPTLQIGSQGATVEELQAILKLLGFYAGSVDGRYQDSTAIAVVAFQQAAGISADGVVGSATWNRLLPPAAPIDETTISPSPSDTSASAASPQPSAPQASSQPQASTPPANPAAGDRPSQTRSVSQSESVDLPILRIGMRGPAVSRLQERLRALGLFNTTVDGIFGPETQSSVEAAQRRYRLNPDGVVGPATWTALLQNN